MDLGEKEKFFKAVLDGVRAIQFLDEVDQEAKLILSQLKFSRMVIIDVLLRRDEINRVEINIFTGAADLSMNYIGRYYVLL